MEGRGEAGEGQRVRGEVADRGDEKAGVRGLQAVGNAGLLLHVLVNLGDGARGRYSARGIQHRGRRVGWSWLLRMVGEMGSGVGN